MWTTSSIRPIRTENRYNQGVLTFQAVSGTLRPQSKPLPALRAGWALVRVRLAGICNTDVEILRGYHAFRGVPGHEFVGDVEEIRGSPEARKQWLGRRVCGEINVSCSAYRYKPWCKFCLRGQRTHCARRTVLGIVAHDGAFAEYLALPIENLHLVPDSVSDEQAVFVEPLAAACEILEQIDVRRFGEAAILGDGKLAQLIALVLRTVLPRITMYGKHEEKLVLARKAGIRTRRVRGDASDLRRAEETFALVVEATGSPAGLALALKSTFHGAASVETWPIVVNELTVIGSRCGPFAKALALLRSGKVDPTPLITRVFPLAKAPQAIRFAQRPGTMKVLLRP